MRWILIAVLYLLPFAANADALLLPTPYIQVSGHGSVSVAPDMLHVALTLEQTDKNLAAAKKSVNDRAQRVIVLAKQLGVADKDIDATAINIWPEYDWHNNARGYLGQHVTRRINLTLHDINGYPELVDGLVKLGVTSIDSVTPDRSDMAKLKARALTQAVEDAYVRAQALATGADVSLGPVYSLSENSGFIAPRPIMARLSMAAASDSNAYNSGNIEISADVQAVYLIKQTH